MKKLFAILLIILAAKVCLAQSADRKVIAQLYNKTVENYFAKLALIAIKAAPAIKPQFILIGDSIASNIGTYPNFTLKVVKDQNDGIREIEKLPGKTGTINVITQKFSADTLDISISNWIVRVKRAIGIRDWHLVTKHIYLLANCGGTNGYIPSGRLVYNRSSQLWTYSSGEEVFAEMNRRNYKL
ncbi:hypothetical protein [Mucilaginibacter sp. FT3.2]|uniref:hypothetical protein n=1 Tax=Mucilaginibacter sp. FT3.2 TaxID=2723090 RepID=UPI0016102633|nr:hypothetical protein [Mucilaginibacter sp. FT3.2]MBB6233738.1 hypothetical protein [Mucilaginibacter sp. FT3.2]